MASIQTKTTRTGNTYKYLVFIDPTTKRVIWQSLRHLNKKQIDQRKRDVENAIAAGTYGQEPSRSKEPIADYLNRWYEVNQHALSPRTAPEYRSILDTHLIPAFGALTLSQLTTDAIEAYYLKLLKAGRSAKTVYNIHYVLRPALQQAVDRGHLVKSPAEGVKLPRYREPEISVGTPEELRAILYHLRGTRWYLPVLLCIVTGMRREEVIALTWRDFHEGQRALLVQRARVRVRGVGVIETETKTRGSVRPVVIPPVMVRLLRRHKQRCSDPSPGAPICQQPHGSPLYPDSLSLAFRRAAKHCGVGVTLHGLRHTHITELIAAGVPFKAVSARVGQTESKTTHRYTHVLPTMQEQAAEIAGTLLPRPAKQRPR